jgi:hypothetical protein
VGDRDKRMDAEALLRHTASESCSIRLANTACSSEAACANFRPACSNHSLHVSSLAYSFTAQQASAHCLACAAQAANGMLFDCLAHSLVNDLHLLQGLDLPQCTYSKTWGVRSTQTGHAYTSSQRPPSQSRRQQGDSIIVTHWQPAAR